VDTLQPNQTTTNTRQQTNNLYTKYAYFLFFLLTLLDHFKINKNMPIIVFACKSNSCRSQMAEGWARDWLQKKKDDVDIKLKHNANNSNSNNDNNNSNNNEENIKQQLSILENTIITSVALDASAVFEEEKTSPTTQTTSSLDMCTRSTTKSSISSNNNNNNNHSSLKRKNIKSKAIEAMANDGVDIKSYIPKTLHEILPFISNNNDHDHSDSSSSSNTNTKEQLFPEHKQAEEEESLSFNDDININKPVDKLIVLCSCGDELKHKIVRRSKSVEEWNIDPPTTAAKNGEGDAAYRRVSLEVKNEVNILMESLIGDALD
jgi:protein-tyrosine-phosphatase